MVIPEGIDLGQPGIYAWDIEGVGTYIGQSKNLRSRVREYPNNIRKLAEALPYRKSKPDHGDTFTGDFTKPGSVASG